MPPTEPMPIDWRSSLPSPPPSAIGSMPTSAAAQLIRTGRNFAVAADYRRHKHGSKHVRLFVQTVAHQGCNVGNRLEALGHRTDHEIDLRKMVATADLSEYVLRLACGNSVTQDKPLARRAAPTRTKGRVSGCCGALSEHPAATASASIPPNFAHRSARGG